MSAIINKLSRDQLVDLVGRYFEEYRKVLDRVDPGHGLLNPSEVLESIVNYGVPLPEGKELLPKRDGETKSGDIWGGNYNIFYLSLGQTQDGLEVFVELGGDTFEQGTVHTMNRDSSENRNGYGHMQTIFPKK